MKHPSAAFAALGLFLVAAVGCSSGTQAPPPTGGNKPVQLTLMNPMGMSIESTQAIIEAYTKKHPNVHITIKDAKADQLQTKTGQVNTAVLDGIDVAVLPQDLAARYNTAGALKDLSSLRLPAFQENIAPLLDELGAANGVRFGVPIGVSPTMVVLNAGALQKASIKPPPLDWSIQDMEQVLTAAKAAGLQSALPQMVMLDPLVRGFGGHMYDAGQHTWTLDTPEVKRGLAEAARLTQAGWLNGGGVTIRFGPDAPALEVLPPEVGFSGEAVGIIMPFPKGPKGRETPVSASVAVVNKNSANGDLAADFVREMLANPASQQALARAGIRPVTADAPAMAAWREKVGEATAQAIDLMMQGAYVGQPVKFYVPLMNGLAPYLNGTAGFDQVVPGLMNSLPN